MSSQRIAVNNYLLWATIFYSTYLVLKVVFPSYEGPYSIMGTLMLIAGGVAGIKACASFGGRKNFTGRIALYFSAALFLVAASMFSSSLVAERIVSPASAALLSDIDLMTFVIAQCLSTYALMASVSAVFDRLRVKDMIYVSLALLFSISVAWFNLDTGTQAGLIHTAFDEFFWVALFPTLIFLQLAGALLLIDFLGKWYAARVIGVIAVGFLCFDLLQPPVTVFVLVTVMGFLGQQITSLLTGINVQAVTAMYLVSLALTQMRPRHKGPFYAVR
jgi:hypothetical protein